ncbi:MAG TPA: hypothetical protein VNO54_13320 [Streptosporangiaceae bacterium]|nr:hypothetical protein [Streptosporangiaceae bacterium]
MSTATAATYQDTFGGRAGEAARVRREITGYLQDCPVAEDIVLIAHELAANAIVHSRSRDGSFAVRCHDPCHPQEHGRVNTIQFRATMSTSR